MGLHGISLSLCVVYVRSWGPYPGLLYIILAPRHKETGFVGLGFGGVQWFRVVENLADMTELACMPATLPFFLLTRRPKVWAPNPTKP